MVTCGLVFAMLIIFLLQNGIRRLKISVIHCFFRCNSKPILPILTVVSFFGSTYDAQNYDHWNDKNTKQLQQTVVNQTATTNCQTKTQGNFVICSRSKHKDCYLIGMFSKKKKNRKMNGLIFCNWIDPRNWIHSRCALAPPHPSCNFINHHSSIV